MPRAIPNRLLRVGGALVIGFALSACGGSDDAAPTSNAKIDPAVPAYDAIEQIAHGRRNATPTSPEESLKGPDTNNNGIRDDIDAYIANRDYTAGQKKAVEQFARGIQEAVIVDRNDRAQVRKIVLSDARAINCLGNFDSQHPQFTHETLQTYQKLTVNTQDRARAYLAYSHALSGSSWTLPQGDTCEN